MKFLKFLIFLIHQLENAKIRSELDRTRELLSAREQEAARSSRELDKSQLEQTTAKGELAVLTAQISTYKRMLEDEKRAHISTRRILDQVQSHPPIE